MKYSVRHIAILNHYSSGFFSDVSSKECGPFCAVRRMNRLQMVVFLDEVPASLFRDQDSRHHYNKSKPLVCPDKLSYMSFWTRVSRIINDTARHHFMPCQRGVMRTERNRIKHTRLRRMRKHGTYTCFTMRGRQTSVD